MGRKERYCGYSWRTQVFLSLSPFLPSFPSLHSMNSWTIEKVEVALLLVLVFCSPSFLPSLLPSLLPTTKGREQGEKGGVVGVECGGMDH